MKVPLEDARPPRLPTRRELRNAVLSAATVWWMMRRPVGYSPEEHLANPTVNCGTEAEVALAHAAAAYVKVIGPAA